MINHFIFSSFLLW